jgi:hypothetical protein
MNPPAPTCPATKPANGTPCPCFEPLSCHYATATCAGQPQDEIASCTPGGTWQLAISSCNPPAVEAGVGDAEPVDAGTADAADAAQPQDAATE